MLVREGNNFSLIKKDNNSRLPKKFRELDFNGIISKVLGRKKEIFVSIVLVKPAEIKKLNRKYRGRNESTDILSFDLNSGGEILISLPDANRKSKNFEAKLEDYLSFLLIHGLLHLKGLEHSSKMNMQEKKLCKAFSVKHPF